jgi:hypothetical protein
MALSDQPYLPLYVDDWMNNNKLKACSAQARGVMIAVMCLMHKAPVYGRLELFQGFAIAKRVANSETCYDFVMSFAKMIARFASMTEQETSNGLRELLDVGSLVIEDGVLICKRMERDGKTSKSRSMAGKRGGEQTWRLTKDADKNINCKNVDNFCYGKSDSKSKNFAIAKPIANAGNDNENEFVVENNFLSFDFDVGVDVKGVDFGGVGVDVKGVKGGEGSKEVSSKGTNWGKGSKEGLPTEATGVQGSKEVPPKGATEGQKAGDVGVTGGGIAQNPRNNAEICAMVAKSGAGSTQIAPQAENALKTHLSGVVDIGQVSTPESQAAESVIAHNLSDYGEKPPGRAAKREKPDASSEFEPPGHLAELWPDYLATRRNRRAVLTLRALSAVVRRIEGLAPGDTAAQREILEQSIRSGYTDVYPLKTGGNGMYGRNSRFAQDDELKRSLAETAVKLMTKNQTEGGG